MQKQLEPITGRHVLEGSKEFGMKNWVQYCFAKIGFENVGIIMAVMRR